MTSHVFTPITLDEVGAFAFLAQLEKATAPVIVDFSQTQFALPLGALMLLSAYRSYKEKDPTLKAVGINLDKSAHGYLGHMGFFKSIGVPMGKRPGEAIGSSTYIPITVLDITDLETAHKSRLLQTYDEPPIGSLVEVEAMKLAKLITQDLRPNINRPVAYCFREIVRNVFEHSGEQRCAVYAQRWTTGFIEVAIVDRGKGILRSLEDKHRVEENRDALTLAIAPGISGTQQSSSKGEWENSGFGLFVLSELGKELGSFTLCSGNTSLLAAADGVSHTDHTASFSGTAVGLKIKQLSPNKFRQLVDEIIERGEARIRARGGNILASKSTRIDDH